jgi:hypothetical protein
VQSLRGRMGGMFNGEQIFLMLVSVFLMAFFVGTCELVQRIGNGTFKFSVRALLITTTLAAIVLGVIVYAARK